MPAYKKQTANAEQPRDYWGDETEGQHFDRLLKTKFGTKRGSRKLAMSVLNLSRRLLNMYVTGERRIPADVFATVNDMEVFNPDAVWDDGVDPLS